MTQLEDAKQRLVYWTDCALRDARNGRGAGPSRTAAAEWATIVLALNVSEEKPAIRRFSQEGGE